MLVASAVKIPTIGIFFFIQKRARHVSAVVHAKMRYKTYPVQVSFSDSPWARVRRRRTNVGPGNQDPEENESADSKKIFYFILIWSCQIQGLTVRPSCLVLKPSLSTSVTSSLSSSIQVESFGNIVCTYMHTTVELCITRSVMYM